jgi:hypothetical protein
MSVYKRKSGQWAVRVDVDRDADGRRVRKNLGTFPTRKAAESAERKALEARERGVDFDLAGLTVGEACDRFLDRCRAKNLAPASLTRYAEHFRDLSAIGTRLSAGSRTARSAESTRPPPHETSRQSPCGSSTARSAPWSPGPSPNRPACVPSH